MERHEERSHSCGERAFWRYEECTKTLKISGEGPMQDYHQGNFLHNTPWNEFKNEIQKIVIGYGITATGRYAFCHMGALKELEFETDEKGFTTVQTIGGYGFCWNTTLETLTLPEGIRFISGRAFSRVENLTSVSLPATLEAVDMYAFFSTSIRKVCYSGGKKDWAKVYVSTQGGNDKYLLDASWTYRKEDSVSTAIAQSAARNRKAEILDELRRAYGHGGDGKLRVLTLHHGGTGKVGDCTLILMPSGEVMLIDTFRADGWDSLRETLDAIGIRNLDYLVLSHGHDDHDGNLKRVVAHIQKNGGGIGAYWSAGALRSANEAEAVAGMENTSLEQNLRLGMKKTIGQVTARILWPPQEGAAGDGNNNSLAVKFCYGSSAYLTCGDLFLDGEEAVLEYYQNEPDALRAAVMKTNHHGSYSSNARAWVNGVDPCVMLTHSDDNGDSALCYDYSRDGRAWYSSGRDGMILVSMDQSGKLCVTTEFDSDLRRYLRRP